MAQKSPWTAAPCGGFVREQGARQAITLLPFLLTSDNNLLKLQKLSVKNLLFFCYHI
jgi:hypothetical protein